MIILDAPYVSEILKNTIRENSIPALCTDKEISRQLCDIPLITTEEAVKKITDSTVERIYSNSENAIGWIARNLSFTAIPEKIELFKNKCAFRRLLQDMFPDYPFQEIHRDDLENFDISFFPRPFILKPAVGFFSMGVKKITGRDDWEKALKEIEEEMESLAGIYPPSVFESTTFIAEEVIEGDEYAVDVYFNNEGKAVILNIMKHLFASENDVSDRVYISSKEIIEENITTFTDFLQKIGEKGGLKNFPCHAEIRVDKKGNMLPIEINPFRFGGWCSTGDLAFMAWGFNPYLYYLEGKAPDWKKILGEKKGKTFAIVVLDNSTGIDAKEITSFDYDKFLKGFARPLELRKINFKKYPVFGFLFTETGSDDITELYDILSSDLKEFITC